MSFTGTSAQEYPFKILLHHLSKGSQGSLEISADEDRWVLYLEGGDRLQPLLSPDTRAFSKLRETAPEADNIAAHPAPAQPEDAHLAGLRRASVRFSQGQRPDKRRSADTLQACWEGLCHGLTDGQMDEPWQTTCSTFPS